MNITIPRPLVESCESVPERAAWLDRLPSLISHLTRRWSLSVGEPFDGEWVLPTLWRSEFLNVLGTAVRAQVLDRSSALLAWQLALATFSGAEHEPAGDAVLTVAIEKRLTAWDAQFVVTALDPESLS